MMSYDNLYRAVKARYPNLPGAFQQERTNFLWREIKENYSNKKDRIKQVDLRIQELQNDTAARKAKATLYFCGQVLDYFCIIYKFFEFFVFI